ncbi:T9SS type A sorting domain-containing protein [Winogradskyella undariae]|uniref:T9SS type A sorting domain-containing protein n=1 Tax=Winogradskyella undariae TaxID=1285465 RepID=UPI00156BCE9A|nr:T9SS type A sorting domain-containing protein [Winogradskyella undariae]NRR91101.1 T9SS type A sorting domain-containing protein [Winogradskyella undariae]
MKTKLLFLLLLISSYAFAQFPTDATKHYSFTNSDITNQAGTNYDLVLNDGYGTPTFVTDRFGNANSATDLNNGHFSMGIMPNRSGYDGNQFAISFWFNTTDLGTLFDQYSNSQEEGWTIAVFNTSLAFITAYDCYYGYSCGYTLDFQYANQNFSDGNWHHVVAMMYKENDGTNQQYIKRLYVDNVLVQDDVQVTLPYDGSQGVGMLGTTNTMEALTGARTSNDRYDGLMDDIYYFERGITTAEVNALYNEGLVVDIPDANLKAALVSDATINTNSDSEIQPAEATNYSGAINVANLNIDNSAGLEAFVNISGLDISNNNLEHLDVSSNTALTSLEANNNQLITLNIQNGNNSNISDANFNVLNNYGLYCIEVDDVSYSNTNWTNINAYTIFSLNCDTANVNIPDIALRTSLLNNTSINSNGDSEIQVAEARDYTVGLYLSTSGIQDITGLQAFANATNLDLSYNNVSIMDLRANRYLTGLHVGDNPLTSLNINGLSSITTVNISNTSLTDVDLSTHESLQYLEAQYVHNINNLDLSSNTNINYIYLSGNMLTNINLRTGTNVSNNLFIETVGSPMLTCVFVDDPAFSLNNSMKDAVTEFYQLDSECANFTLNTEDVVFQNNEISIYPNPTKSTINIKTESNVANVSVYSLLGKEVIKTNTKTVDVSSLSEGIYLIKVIDLDGNQHVKRFIKK